MVKFWMFVGLLLSCSLAHADETGPWFGGAGLSPEQINVSTINGNLAIQEQNPDCTIYSCPITKKLAKPQQKSASNP